MAVATTSSPKSTDIARENQTRRKLVPSCVRATRDTQPRSGQPIWSNAGFAYQPPTCCWSPTSPTSASPAERSSTPSSPSMPTRPDRGMDLLSLRAGPGSSARHSVMPRSSVPMEINDCWVTPFTTAMRARNTPLCGAGRPRRCPAWRPRSGTVGDAFDNALAKTTIGLYKTEAERPDSPFRRGPLDPSDRRNS